MKYINGGWVIEDGDVINRELIVFPEKWLGDTVNAWFRQYYIKHSKDGKVNEKYVNKRLMEKYGFTKDDFGIWLLDATPLHLVGDKSDKFTITSNKGEKVIFDNFNGLYYTATETGTEFKYVLFDHGDFYCLGNIYPFAMYNYIKARNEKFDRMQKEKEAQDG